MDAARDNPAGAAAPAAGAYCRRCGYSLRGLASGRCPECGGAFDLANRKTFARRPPRVRLKRWARRVALLVALLAPAAASVPGWYWWQWRAEEKVIGELRQFGARVHVSWLEPDGLAAYVPERWAPPRRRAIGVYWTDATPEQFERVDFLALGHLQILRVDNGQVGDAALARIAGLRGLDQLGLMSNPLDGSGLAHLAGYRRLTGLDLSITRVDDAGLAQVGRLTSLRFLDLQFTRVTDAGMGHLSSLTSLETLQLYGTGVTDAGLLKLRGLTSLRMIWVPRETVTQKGRQELKRLLPNLTIKN